MTTALANVTAGTTLTPDNETAAAAASAQAKALVEARFLVALHRPRSIDQFRTKLMLACKRSTFAEVAKYRKPIGGKDIIGASIRFAEEAARCFGNLDIDASTTFDSDEKRVIHIGVTDLESNVSYGVDVTLNKQVERKSLRKGQVALGQRINSYGETTYLVEAGEDELLTKQLAASSKHIRTGILRHLPGDIVEECLLEVDRTNQNEDAKDPDATRKRMIDKFYTLGITVAQLAEYLGHPTEVVSPGEIQQLRTIYAAIGQGETNWAEVMESKGGNGTAKTGTGSLKDKVRAKVETGAADQQRETRTAEEIAEEKRLAAE